MTDTISADEYNALLAEKRKPKYGNVRTVVDGIAFDSKAEAKRYAELRLLLDAGTIYGLRLQPRYRLEVNGIKICDYVGDFAYVNERGDAVVEDVKSSATKTRAYGIKKKLMWACHGIEIQEIERA